jgi:class 3 adenylate cyclase
MEERQVTILSSDIQDFTKMSEQLGQVELLFMLTRYLSVMQRVVHMYKGVIGEILGDGLLIYWNTPDDVEKHAELACAAAVLMQDKVMDLLNDEFSHVNLPRIKIRIGIHTALVSSGIVGSEMKKKFGCLGAGVDVAEHLESSCKRLQKRTLVSERTLNALPLDSGFRYEEVGIEQVDGEDEPLKIYELISRDWSPDESQPAVSDVPSAPDGEEDVAAPPEVAGVTRTMSRAACALSSPEQQQSPSGFPGIISVRSRRSNASRVSFGRDSSVASGRGAVRVSSRRTTLQDDQDAAQAVAESGESLQRNAALFSDAMLQLLQSTSSVASLSDPTSLAHLVRL